MATIPQIPVVLPVKKAARPSMSLSMMLALGMLFLVAVLVIIVPLLPIYDPSGQSLRAAKIAPFTNLAHPFGTDPLGRDTLSRLAAATRLTILVSVGAVAISAVMGLAIGLIAGWKRGRVEAFLMAVGNIQLSIPIILLLIVLVATLGSGAWLLIVLIGLTNWVGYGRVVRSLTVSLREREFVTAVTTAGGSGWWIIRKHLLPNVLPEVLILGAFDLGLIVTIESSLSFIGLGIQPPEASLGLMISESQRYLQTNPALTVFPALAIFFLIGGMQFISQGLGAGRKGRAQA